MVFKLSHLADPLRKVLIFATWASDNYLLTLIYQLFAFSYMAYIAKLVKFPQGWTRKAAGVRDPLL